MNQSELRIRDLERATYNKLSVAIKEANNWKLILDNLPPLSNGQPIRVEKKSLLNMEQCPGSVLEFLMQRAVSIKDLLTTFEKICFERGLLILNAPERPIELIRRSPNNIYVRNGRAFELICLVDCFPYPTYEYYLGAQKIGDNPLLRIENAK